MPTKDSPRLRGARRARSLLQRFGHEARLARIDAAVSLRTVAAAAGISHTHLWRIERGETPHVDIDVLARVAEVIGCELSLGLHPDAAPVRDKAHIALLGRLRDRLHPRLRWRSEVPMPLPGDRRSADAVITGATFTALVEAETRLGDVQAVERRISAKARDLRADRSILLVLDSRHDRAAIRSLPELSERFPVSTRQAMAALARGDDPGGDCLIVL